LPYARKAQCLHESIYTVAIAGNPNVGKSTLFNSLTGLNQHTGNWPGKTVSNARGRFSSDKNDYILVDIPGTYSLMSNSVEEEIARNFLCFGNTDAVIVVCDATCLERNLNLVLQTIELAKNAIVCVNLLDEAKRKGIKIDLNALSRLLGVPVVGVIARKKSTLPALISALDDTVENRKKQSPMKIKYAEPIEKAISILQPVLDSELNTSLNTRFLSLKLIDGDTQLLDEMHSFFGYSILDNNNISNALDSAKEVLKAHDLDSNSYKDSIVTSIVLEAERIAKQVVKLKTKRYDQFDRRLDRIFTSKWTGYPIMLLLLTLVLYLTISGANYPSQLLADGLYWVESQLDKLFHLINAPPFLHGIAVQGMLRVLAWVVSVMLPPMAIFFPLFTLLEDSGYLPRVAYNLDKPFKKCSACGKQALTMCMGFGCTAVGVVGCRIIDSPRERLIAILTNSFVPCNGKLPTLIAVITMFFAITGSGLFNSIISAAMLAGIIVLGVLLTFLASKLLSKTILKGVPSSFTLELPPYRKPQVLKVLVRSLLDRTLFVLGRAVLVAAPAGIIIWLFANIYVGGETLLTVLSRFLDPFARLFGLDGVILMAFILGFPANEVVIPITIMAYMSKSSILELSSLESLKQLFIANGWTWVTAVCVLIFSLMHWPCSTTLLTIKKETGSLKWTALSVIIPTLIGFALCFVFANIARLFC
jgi:ferrous iron transport protein B